MTTWLMSIEMRNEILRHAFEIRTGRKPIELVNQFTGRRFWVQRG